jgi:hypothetical protein
MGIATMIRRVRQQDALDAACEAIKRKTAIIGAQAAKIEFLERSEVPRLEAEILRLRKNALTPTPERVDNSVVKAKSTADVRRITEAAFGRELLNQKEEEHGE